MTPSTYRAPAQGEAAQVSGWGVAEALRAHRGWAFQSPALDAILDRLELHEDPIQVRVSPYRLHLAFAQQEAEELGRGDVLFEHEWCVAETQVFISVPEVEGLKTYLESCGLFNLYIPVMRRFITLIDDPHDCWSVATSKRAATR